jgi:hypothetical protein
LLHEPPEQLLRDDAETEEKSSLPEEPDELLNLIGVKILTILELPHLSQTISLPLSLLKTTSHIL